MSGHDPAGRPASKRYNEGARGTGQHRRGYEKGPQQPVRRRRRRRRFRRQGRAVSPRQQGKVHRIGPTSRAERRLPDSDTDSDPDDGAGAPVGFAVAVTAAASAAPPDLPLLGVNRVVVDR